MRYLAALLLLLASSDCAQWHADWVAKCGPGNDPALMPCSCNNAGTPDCYPPLNDNGDPTMWADATRKDAIHSSWRRYDARKVGYLPCEKKAPHAEEICYDRAGITWTAGAWSICGNIPTCAAATEKKILDSNCGEPEYAACPITPRPPVPPRPGR